MHEATDPRKNAPPRISDLSGEALNQALYARAEGGRIAYMRSFERGLVKRSLFSRVKGLFR